MPCFIFARRHIDAAVIYGRCYAVIRYIFAPAPHTAFIATAFVDIFGRRLAAAFRYRHYGLTASIDFTS